MRSEGRPAESEDRSTLRTLVLVFLRLGLFAFGGPAAHIAMMRHELVVRRRWVSEQRFLDLLGITNLIPGPNSTEMAIHLGLERAGWRGLIAAGLAFIMPAAAIVAGLAWIYVELGQTPALGWVLYGVKPVVIAIVAHALWGLGRRAVRSVRSALVAGAVLALSLAGVNELALLAAGGLGGAALSTAPRLRGMSGLLPFGALLPALSGTVAGAGAGAGGLFLLFLKIGAVLYGSGYVLLAFLRGDLVERLGWLTDQQLLDAIAIGQLTPGPLFTTATFVGFLVGGAGGAALATAGIFLPAFVFVAAVNPWISRLRASSVTAALLDAVNASALGLMAAVTVVLAQAALLDTLTVGLALVALLVLLRARLNSAWLILAGGAVGTLARGLGG